MKPSELIQKKINEREFLSYDRGSGCGSVDCECYQNAAIADYALVFLDRLAELNPELNLPTFL